jgi:hypothetical protein
MLSQVENEQKRAKRKNFMLYEEEISYIEQMGKEWNTRSEATTLRRIILEHKQMTEKLKSAS